MKKNINKITSIVLLSTFLISNSVYAKSFSDLSKKGDYQWAYSAVDQLSNKGVFGGYPDGTFKPQRPVSFLEIMQVIKNIKNPSSEELKLARDEFSKITKSNKVPSWAEDAINYALYTNIITEKTLKSAVNRGFIQEGKVVFPDRNSVTVYFGRAFGFSGNGDKSKLKHKDLKSIPESTKGYLAELVDANIYAATGSDGYFNGKKYIRRAEVAVVADKAINYLNANQKPEEKTEDYKTEDLTVGLIEDVKEIKGIVEKIYSNSIKIDGISYGFNKDNIKINDETNLYRGDLESLIGSEVLVKVSNNNINSINILSMKENNKEENNNNSNNEIPINIKARVINSKETNRDDYEISVIVIVSNSEEFVAGSEIVVYSDKDYLENEIVDISGFEINGEIKDLGIK